MYVPQATLPLALTGADSTFNVNIDSNKLAIGFYMLLLPGQTQTIQLDYLPKLAAKDTYQLLVQKQAGTRAHPFTLRVQHPSIEPLELHTDLWTDREFSIELTNTSLHSTSILTPTHPSNTSAQLAKSRHWLQGWHYWQQGASTKAIEHWQTTTTLSMTLDHLVGLRSSGEHQTAEQLWSMLHTAEPELARLTFIGAQLAHDRGDHQQAQELYTQVIDAHPNPDTVRLHLVQLALDQAQPAAALSMLQTLDDPLAVLRRQEFLAFAEQDYATAKQLNLLILELEPVDAIAWEQRYQIERLQPPIDWQALLAFIKAAQEHFPNQATWLQRQAEAHMQLEQPQQALQAWQQVSVLSPTNHLAWYQQGVLLAQQGELESAVQALEQATQLNQHNVTYYMTLGGYYRVLEHPEAALAAYQRAAELDPENPTVQRILAELSTAP